MEFLATKIVSTVRELEGALNRSTAQMQLVGRELTLESVQEVLHDLLRANERRVTIDEIQKAVAEHFTIKMAEMTSSPRAPRLPPPPPVSGYLAKQPNPPPPPPLRPHIRPPPPPTPPPP